jgi:hypothetical protein
MKDQITLPDGKTATSYGGAYIDDDWMDYSWFFENLSFIRVNQYGIEFNYSDGKFPIVFRWTESEVI